MSILGVQVKLLLDVECIHARVASAVAELLLDAEKLIVLSNTLRARGRACLYLAGVERDCEVSDSSIGSLARAV